MANEGISNLIRSTFRGVWDADYPYQFRDICQSAGSLWLCKAAHTNVTPVQGDTWDLLVSKGDDGAAGHTQNTDTDLDATFEASLKNTDNHTDGTTNKVYSATDKSKLAGVEASAVALSTVKADADVSDAITKKHANTQDHSNASDHTQGTDQGLDNGGANAVTAAQTKAAYTHSGTAHLAFVGLAKITVGIAEPTSPNTNDVWIDTN